MLGGPQLSDPVLWNKPCQTSLYFPLDEALSSSLCWRLSTVSMRSFLSLSKQLVSPQTEQFPKYSAWFKPLEKIEHFRWFNIFWNIFKFDISLTMPLNGWNMQQRPSFFLERSGWELEKTHPDGFCWTQQLLAVRGVRVVVILRNHGQIESDWMPETQIWARFFIRDRFHSMAAKELILPHGSKRTR